MPLLLQIYLFNITNPEEILAGAAPVLQEVNSALIL